MTDLESYFKWEGVHLEHFYIYFLLAAIISFYLVIKSTSKFKIEMFLLSFYLLTGNINQLLTIKIPGLDLLQLQPLRILYLLLFFLIIRKTLLSRNKVQSTLNKKIPRFEVALYAYVLLLIISVVVNSSDIGIEVVLKKTIDALAFLVLMISLRLMADKPSYRIIGISIIIGAVISSVVSLLQLAVDPYFLRIGDDRIAFGSLIRSNGIFSTEYFNSYYLIIATAWTLITVKSKSLKLILVGLFVLGVLSSFQRMSWIILFLVTVTYLLYIQKYPVGKLVFIGLSGMAILLSISIFFFQDIKNSSLVQERLTDSVERRRGYYTMVIDNIGHKPLFGYGDRKNEVYYENMLRITGSRERATAQSGDLHSGYFSALYLFGIPAFICFTSFVLLSVFYYAKAYKSNLFFAIPFLVSIIYMIGNLTNTFLFLKYIAVLYAIHIGIGMGINKIQEDKKSTN